jgi:hypothetical protein
LANKIEEVDKDIAKELDTQENELYLKMLKGVRKGLAISAFMFFDSIGKL